MKADEKFNKIKTKDKEIKNVIFYSKYANIASDRPTGMNIFLFAGLLNQPSGTIPVVIGSNGIYAFANVANGTEYSYIVIRYFYTN